MFYALRFVDTLNLTLVTNELYRIFWLVYPKGGWDPGLDSCYMSFMYNTWLENPGLDSHYKWIIQNVLTGVPWGWVTPWTWLMLQVNYLDCFDWYTLRVGETLDLTHVTSQLYRMFWLVCPEGGWDPGLDSCYKSIIYNVLNWKPWGWVRPWTWLMLQVNYIECFDLETQGLGETLDLN